MLPAHTANWTALNETIQALVVSAKAGDHKATNELALTIQKSRIIRRWAARVLGNRGDSVPSSTIRNLAEGMETSGLCLIADCLRTYNPDRGTPFIEYLRKTCGYEWVREANITARSRKIDRMSVHLLPEEMDDVPGREREPVEQIVLGEELSRIEPALARLNDKDAAIIREYYGVGREKGRTLEEMDAEAGLSRGAHHMRLKKAKKQLAFAYGRA